MYIYNLSILFVMIILVRKRVNLLSPSYLLLAFNSLYTYSIYFGHNFNYGALSLLDNLNLVNWHMNISSSVNIALGLSYLVFFKKLKYINLSKKNKVFTSFNHIIYVLVYILIGIALSVFGNRYGWDAVSHYHMHSKLASLYFYGRIMYAAMFIYYFVHKYKKLDIVFFIMIVLQIVVTMIDNGRTTIVPTLALIMYFLIEKHGFKFKYLFFILLSFLIMLITRALIMEGSLVTAMLSSIFIEGAFGSYSSLNVLNIILNGTIKSYTYGLSYIIDPIIWSIPFSDTNLTFFKKFVSLNFSNISFTPMGGFYFVAEANAAIPIIGPFLITLIISSFFAILERKYNKENLFFIAMYVSVGFLFTKIIFGNAIKIFVIYFASLIVINFFTTLRIKRETRFYNNK